ncbi:hypothetical protein EAG_08934 [Camponotus floridanus]|uniref:Uncharacterized protein n=1 Tax=Camponotus floridanus TaxID=104421 RepID=E2AQL3_CAMFO|nr:hypothetical protein EAG_08934 [Camponotus floridanus]
MPSMELDHVALSWDSQQSAQLQSCESARLTNMRLSSKMLYKKKNNLDDTLRECFAIPKGRNVGVSGGSSDAICNADFDASGYLRRKRPWLRPRTSLGGVTRGVVPPLTNTWKQGSRRRAGERERVNRRQEVGKQWRITCLSSATRPPRGLIAPVHVPLRTQDSSVTRPGDMGTSSAKVNGLLRAPDAFTLHRLGRCERQTIDEAPFASTATIYVTVPRADGRAHGCGSEPNRDQHAARVLLLCCAASRHLAVRADSLPRDDAQQRPRRNVRAGMMDYAEEEICLRGLDQIPIRLIINTSVMFYHC